MELALKLLLYVFVAIVVIFIGVWVNDRLAGKNKDIIVYVNDPTPRGRLEIALSKPATPENAQYLHDVSMTAKRELEQIEEEIAQKEQFMLNGNPDAAMLQLAADEAALSIANRRRASVVKTLAAVEQALKDAEPPKASLPPLDVSWIEMDGVQAPRRARR